MLYSFLLPFHNILRWVVLIAALFVLIRMFAGWLGKKVWTKTDNQAGMIYTLVMDIQVLVGLILYFVASPLTTAALRNFGGAMKDAGIRFFAVEHVFGMIVALALAHVGRSLSRKASGAPSKFRAGAIWFTLSFLALLVSIPWPFLQAAGRPWFRF